MGTLGYGFLLTLVIDISYKITCLILASVCVTKTYCSFLNFVPDSSQPLPSANWTTPVLMACPISLTPQGLITTSLFTLLALLLGNQFCIGLPWSSPAGILKLALSDLPLVWILSLSWATAADKHELLIVPSKGQPLPKGISTIAS